MIPDLDIYRSANVLVKQHGQDAPIPASTVGVQRYLCPLWGKTGSPAWASECPLLGVKRKSISGD